VSIYRTGPEPTPDYGGREVRRWWKPGMRTGYTSPDLFNVAAWWWRRQGREVVWVNDGDGFWSCIQVYRKYGVYSHGGEIPASSILRFAILWYLVPWFMAKLRREPYGRLRHQLSMYLNRYVPRPWIPARLRWWLRRKLEGWR
jgi:hypothetical protein